jgi:hypothetical protein
MKIQIKKSQDLYEVVAAAAQYSDESVFKLKSAGIIQELEHPSGASAYASLIPESAMETYDVDHGTEIGVRIGDIEGIIPNTDDPVTLDIGQGRGIHRIKMSVAGRTYTVPLTDVSDVAQIPESVPNLDLPIKIYGDDDWIMDFITEAQSYVFDGNDRGHFWISASDGVLQLYSSRDGYELAETIHWEDFDDYEINWDELSPPNKKGIDIRDPTEQKRAEVLLSLNLTSDINVFGEQARLGFGHAVPMKVVCQTETDVKATWFISPRFPASGELGKVPDRVIEDRTLAVTDR